MTEVQQMAQFVHAANYAQLSSAAIAQLKIRILDTVGVAIAALDAAPIQAIRQLLDELGGTGQASRIGGGRNAVDRVAFYNIGLSRYLDFMDSYLAPGETCHPSDNIGAVLATAELAGASGKEFLTAVAVAYQVQTLLSRVAPVRAHGFDHTVQGAYASAAASAKALRLSPAQIGNALAISGTANNALRVTRTGRLSNWKGLAYPNTAKEGVFAALLARAGITGPEEVFEGNKGFKQTIAGDFQVDWSRQDLEGVLATIIKKYNAEIHSQTTLEAAVELRQQAGFAASRIRAVRVHTFQVAYDIIGGGEEGDKHTITTKEEADHSLPYMVAAALLDGDVQPAQYELDRIRREDIQALLKKVTVIPDDGYSRRFPEEMPSRVEIEFMDGRRSQLEKDAYHGFHSQPLDWEAAFNKYSKLVTPFAGAELRDEIAITIQRLEQHEVGRLTELLARVPTHRS